MEQSNQTAMPTQLGNQTVEIKNPGQQVIYQIRKAYLEGALAVSSNPAPDIQLMLNKPTAIKSGEYKVSPKDKAFLKDVLQKVEAGEIKLFTPSSLLNQPVYEKLSPDLRTKAEYDILVLLHKIRQIKKLWDAGDRNSYQIMNLVHSLRLAKESLESAEGDVFII